MWSSCFFCSFVFSKLHFLMSFVLKWNLEPWLRNHKIINNLNTANTNLGSTSLQVDLKCWILGNLNPSVNYPCYWLGVYFCFMNIFFLIHATQYSLNLVIEIQCHLLYLHFSFWILIICLDWKKVYNLFVIVRLNMNASYSCWHLSWFFQNTNEKSSYKQ